MLPPSYLSWLKNIPAMYPNINLCYFFSYLCPLFMHFNRTKINNPTKLVTYRLVYADPFL